METTAPARIDSARQRRAREYARIRRRLWLADTLLSTAYLLAWLVFGWGARLRDLLPGPAALDVALFAAVFGGGMLLVGLPLSVYSGYFLPHRYDLSTQTPGGWILDQVKGLTLGGLLGLAALEAVYAVLRAFPETWWLWAAGLMLVFSVLLSTLAPVVLMPLFNKFVPLGQEHAALAERLVGLSRRAGAEVGGVYRFDMSRRTKAANAALTGLGRTRRMILGDTLLDAFSADEIETVMAHELGHHVHRDIPLLIAFDTLVTLAGFWLAARGLDWGAAAFGLRGPADPAAMPVLALVFGLYGLVTMPLSNAFSRWRERLADDFALRLTGNGPAFAAAMTRLADQNLAEIDPEPWVEWLFYSHPALGRRIRRAEVGQNAGQSGEEQDR